MRFPISSLVAIAVLALTATAGHAYGLKPGWRAHSQLVYGSGWAHYDAGCTRWMPFVKSWYNTCTPLTARRVPVVVAKY